MESEKNRVSVHKLKKMTDLGPVDEIGKKPAPKPSTKLNELNGKNEAKYEKTKLNEKNEAK